MKFFVQIYLFKICDAYNFVMLFLSCEFPNSLRGRFSSATKSAKIIKVNKVFYYCAREFYFSSVTRSLTLNKPSHPRPEVINQVLSSHYLYSRENLEAEVQC